MRNIKDIVEKINSRKKPLIIGAAYIDMIIGIESLPSSGEDIEGVYKEMSVGGCAFNVADVLRKLDIDFDMFMPVGNGFYGNFIKKAFKERSYPIYENGSGLDNGWCLSLVENTGERTFITMPGLENKMQEEWFCDFKIEEYDYFYISGYQMEGDNGKVLLNVLKRRKDGAKIIFDPGPRGKFIEKNIMRSLMDSDTIFTLNEKESLELTGCSDVEAAGKFLYEESHNPAVITLGGRGAVIADGSLSYIDGFKVKVADTIGAGDSHTGGIIAGLAGGLPLEEAVLLGNKIAAYVTAHMGAACAPTKDLLMR